MQTRITATKGGRNTLILLALVILSAAGACKGAAPAKPYVDDGVRALDDLLRGASQFDPPPKLDRSALRASICNAIDGVRLEDPSGGAAGKVAAKLISDGINDKDARDISSQLIERILGQKISFSDWHSANC
jgi:hypothetical protein